MGQSSDGGKSLSEYTLHGIILVLVFVAIVGLFIAALSSTGKIRTTDDNKSFNFMDNESYFIVSDGAPPELSKYQENVKAIPNGNESYFYFDTDGALIIKYIQSLSGYGVINATDTDFMFYKENKVYETRRSCKFFGTSEVIQDTTKIRCTVKK